MIYLKNVCKSYPTKNGRKYALRNLSTSIPTDKNIGILGRNGAGKSTLLRLIGKIDYPDSGEVLSRQQISWPIGMGAYQGSMSARENTRFVGRIHGVRPLQLLEERVAGFAEIGPYFDMPINTYSSGMRSRFTFALSMAFDFDVYLIDEITAVGDRSFRRKCAEALAEKTKNASLIMVSHNLGELEKQCDAGILLENGEIRSFDCIHEAIDVYKKTVAAC